MRVFATLICCLISLAASLPSASAKELWGYADKSGKVVIKPQFVRTFGFSHGYAECFGYSPDTGVPDWKNCIFIDKQGRKSILPSNGYSRPTSQTEIYDVVEVDGKKIIQDNFISIWSTRENFQFVKRAYDFSICDLEGHILKKILPPWLVQGVNPATGNQWCRVGDKAYDFTGVTKSEMPGFEETKMPPNIAEGYDYCDGFYEDLAATMTKDGHWLYLNREGKVAIKLPEDCSNAQAFSEGLAAVAVGGTPWKDKFSHARINANKGAKFGFIDKTGYFVIPPQFPCPPAHWTNNAGEGSQFHDGIAIATGWQNGSVGYGYIDRKGKFVLPPIYRSVGRLADGMIAINSQPVGFDKDEWAEKRQGYFRRGFFSSFVRQFELVGMSRSEVEKLLGKPDTSGVSANSASYYLEASCTHRLIAEIQYSDEKVVSYRVIGARQGQQDLWIYSKAKPGHGEDLIEFCAKNGIKK